MKCSSIEICTESQSHRAWILLLLYSMFHLKRTGLETILGLNKAGRRVFLYHQLRGFLDEETRKYWDQNEKIIRKGILYDADLERVLRRLRYPKGTVRWNLFGRMMLPRLFGHEKKFRLNAVKGFERINSRKKSMWSFPWRFEHLLVHLPEHQKKSILPKIHNILVHQQSITDRIKNAEENSFDLFMLWDSIEHLEELWPSIQHAGTRESFVLIASREEEPSWLPNFASYVVSSTDDAHFSYGRVSWLRVHLN